MKQCNFSRGLRVCLGIAAVLLLVAALVCARQALAARTDVRVAAAVWRALKESVDPGISFGDGIHLRVTNLAPEVIRRAGAQVAVARVRYHRLIALAVCLTLGGLFLLGWVVSRSLASRRVPGAPPSGSFSLPVTPVPVSPVTVVPVAPSDGATASQSGAGVSPEVLFRELVTIGRAVRDASYHNSGFLYPDANRDPVRDPRTREIGWSLHALGGKTLMLRAHAVVRQELGPVAARGLEACWHEVGEWLG